MKRLGCLHAHFSNISYIEEALSKYSIELQHFVDPGLMMRMANDSNFTTAEAKNKVKEQINWIAKTGVDAILITCTNYIALIEENSFWNVPVIKIDEPFFNAFSKLSNPRFLIFTNPKTIEGTTKRLNQHLQKINAPNDYKVVVIPEAFEYLMNGKMKEHNDMVVKSLTKLFSQNSGSFAIGQLSMVEAGENIDIELLNLLDPLIEEILSEMQLMQ
ncbi:hypothetical protein ACWV26_13045 [Rummeliibacillus sp. JY-2-4R]